MVLIVIPAYNESQKIGRVIRDLFEHGWRDVVVVDDGSTDNTATVAEQSGARVISHRINCGQGAALQTGNEYALRLGADAVVHYDGDGQFNAADILGAVNMLAGKQFDVVLGSRFLDNRSQIPWLKHKIILPFSRLLNWMFTGVMLSDAHNGFRVLSRAALEKIIISQYGMAHNSEIVRQIKKYQLRYVEFPVEVKYFEFGQGIGGGVRILWDLVKEMMVQ